MGRSKSKQTSESRQARDARGGLPDRESEANAILIVKIIGAFMALGVAIVFPYMLLGSGGSVMHVDLDDVYPDQLKHMFFGGDPWLFVCTTKNGSPLALDKFTQASYDLQPLGVTVATIRCGGTLPSGKKLMDRFNLTPPIKKAAFLCANGKKCVQLPKGAMSSSDAITKWVKPRVDLQIFEPTNAAQFGKVCTLRKLCVVSAKDGPHSQSELDTLRKAASQRRAVPIAIVDASKRTLSLRKKLPSDTVGPHVVLVRNEGGNALAALMKDGFSSGAIKGAIDAAVANVTEFTPLKKRPTLSTSKPRRRKATRSSSSSSKEGSSPSSSRSTTKEQRRAARQQRQRKNRNGNSQKIRVVDKASKKTADKTSTSTSADETKGEGLVSDEERERRRQMDDEMASMFEPIDVDAAAGDAMDHEDDEDAYYEEVVEEVVEEDQEEDQGSEEEGEEEQSAEGVDGGGRGQGGDEDPDDL
eukprot:m.18259 g.18259  ORF g.18259 m.18259 type:complete len:472 (-) comp3578_c0_seq2:153-1568(-)